MDIVRTTPEECLEGEHLKFKAHIQGWKSGTRERRCQSLLEKTEHNLRKALLSTPWKDVLLVPQAWYLEYTPKYEAKGWDQQAKDVWGHLHQRWGKIGKVTEGDNIRVRACIDANASGQFTRIVQRKNLPWENDSIAKVAYDPTHIPDCK